MWIESISRNSLKRFLPKILLPFLRCWLLRCSCQDKKKQIKILPLPRSHQGNQIVYQPEFGLFIDWHDDDEDDGNRFEICVNIRSCSRYKALRQKLFNIVCREMPPLALLLHNWIISCWSLCKYFSVFRFMGKECVVGTCCATICFLIFFDVFTTCKGFIGVLGKSTCWPLGKKWLRNKGKNKQTNICHRFWRKDSLRIPLGASELSAYVTSGPEYIHFINDWWVSKREGRFAGGVASKQWRYKSEQGPSVIQHGAVKEEGEVRKEEQEEGRKKWLHVRWLLHASASRGFSWPPTSATFTFLDGTMEVLKIVLVFLLVLLLHVCGALSISSNEEDGEVWMMENWQVKSKQWRITNRFGEVVTVQWVYGSIVFVCALVSVLFQSDIRDGRSNKCRNKEFEFLFQTKLHYTSQQHFSTADNDQPM